MSRVNTKEEDTAESKKSKEWTQGLGAASKARHDIMKWDSKQRSEAGEMTERGVRAPAAEIDNLSLVPRVSLAEGREPMPKSCPLSSTATWWNRHTK